jgi:NTE family protein
MSLDGKPRIGIVIGSGGIKALAAISLLEFIEEQNIPVELLIGCSGGSLIGGYWASGKSASSIRENVFDLWSRDLFTKTDYRTLLSIAGLPFGRFDLSNGLIKADRIKKRYQDMWGEQKIEDLEQRMFFQATEALSGNPVLLKHGLVWEAAYASGALFPILPAIQIQNQFLIDGVFSSPLPVMEMVSEGIDVIIAMSFEELTDEPSRGFVPYFMRTTDYFQRWLRRNQTALSIDLHHHEMIFVNVVFDRYISFWATRKIPQILAAGDKAVQERKAEILNAIATFSGETR